MSYKKNKKILALFLIATVIISNFSGVGKTISKASSDESVNYSNVVSESRKIININKDWNFDSCDESDEGWDFPTEAKSGKIALPHTWEYTHPTKSYIANMNKKTVEYTKSLDVSSYGNKNCFLKFNGVSRNADVYIDGEKVGTHIGGYTAFVFDITDYVKGKQNVQLKVKVTNIDTDTIPINVDYTQWAGIYRDVEIILCNDQYISLEDNGSSGIFINSNQIASDAAVSTKIELSNKADKDTDVMLNAVIKNAEGEVVASKNENVKVTAATTSQAVTLSQEIKNVTLWDGTNNPYMYSMNVSLTDGTGAVIDELNQNFGVRKFEVKNGKAYLNGKQYVIHGVGYHQDRQEYGNITKAEFKKQDIDTMLEMGVNAIRTAHYPHDQLTYNLADENGLVVYNEIPYYLLFSKKKSYGDSIISQLKEMIRQGYNHPSIIMWGTLNEVMYNQAYASYGEDFDITKEELVNFNKNLTSMAKKEDSSRLIVQGNIDYEWSAKDTALWSKDIDITGFNMYRGFKSAIDKCDESGRNDIIESLNDAIENYKKILNTDQLMLSEYGAGANIEQHTEVDEDFSWSGNDSVQTHYEELQTYVLETYQQFLNSRNGIPLSFVWNMFDFSCYRNEGGTKRLNTKGLVCYDHQTKKDAFYFFKAAWNKKDKFVWLTDKRFTNRNKKYQNIKAYSNCEKVELLVNGVSYGYGTKQQDGVFIWNKVEFGDSTDLKVIAYDNDNVYTDSVENLTTKGYGYHELTKDALKYNIKDEVYDGEKKTVSVTGPSSMGAVSVKYYSDESYSKEVKEVRNAGTYYVKAYVDKAVYNEKTNPNPFNAGTFELGEWKILKAGRDVPDVSGENETVSGKNDGKIKGVSSDMEYRLITDSDYTACSEDEIDNLAPGVYYVRYKDDDNHNAGDDKIIVIGEGRMLSVGFKTPYGSLKNESVNVKYESMISKPDISEVPGYSFAGWYKDAEFTNVWDFEKDKVCEDIELYAKWKADDVIESPVPTTVPTAMPDNTNSPTEITSATPSVKPMETPIVTPTETPYVKLTETPTVAPTVVPTKRNISKLDITAKVGSKNIKINTLKSADVKVVLSKKIIISGKKKVKSIDITAAANKTGTVNIKLSEKLSKGMKVKVTVLKNGYKTKTVTQTIKADKLVNKLNISVSKNRKQVVIKTLKLSKVEVKISEKIIVGRNKKVKKLIVKADKNKNGIVKIKLSRKLKKKEKVTVTVSKTGYRTRKKIVNK